MRPNRVPRLAALLLALAAVTLVGCGSDDDEPTDTTTTPPPTSALPTTAAPAPDAPTTAPGAPVTVGPAPTTTEVTAAPTTDASTAVPLPIEPAPGSPCELGSFPDCIDPEGDGTGIFLLDGAACMVTFRDSPGLCSDLDGDGYAGYPDSG